MARDIEKSNAHFTEEELIQLGWVEDRIHSSHFENFGHPKPQNKIRIGIFGESYAAGSEVGVQSDFPSLLQKILDDIAPKKYQILNFGAGSYGFTQAHLLYKIVEKRFNLDIIVFLTLNFNAIRDQNLVYPQSPGTNRIKGPVHSRYYLEDNQVKQLKILGLNRVEANNLYNSFFFPLSYLPFTYFLPPVLSSLLPYQKDYRTNPFYYDRRFSPQESYTIYEKIMSKMATEQKNKKFLIITNIEELLNPSILEKNLFFTKFDPFKLKRHNEILYSTPCCHLSPFGNFELAKHTLQSLLSFQIIEKPKNWKLDSWKTKILAVNFDQTVKACLDSGLNPGSAISDIYLSSEMGTPIAKLFKMHKGEFDDPSLFASYDKIDYSKEFNDKTIIIFGLNSSKRLLLLPIDKKHKISPFQILRLSGDDGASGYFEMIQLAQSIFFLKPINDLKRIEHILKLRPQTNGNQYLESFLGARIQRNNGGNDQEKLQVTIKSSLEAYLFRSVQEYDELLTDELKLTEIFLRVNSSAGEINCKLFDVTKNELIF